MNEEERDKYFNIIIDKTIKKLATNPNELFDYDKLQVKYNNLMKEKINLQQENKQLKEKLDKYENPEDMTLFTMWCTEKIKDENKQLKEQVDRLIKKEYEKDNDYIVKVRTGEQLEREQYLLNFKSKSMLASMLIDVEEKIDKAIELLQNSQIYNARSNGKTLFVKLIEEEIEILKGENNE